MGLYLRIPNGGKTLAEAQKDWLAENEAESISGYEVRDFFESPEPMQHALLAHLEGRSALAVCYSKQELERINWGSDVDIWYYRIDINKLRGYFSDSTIEDLKFPSSPGW